MQADDTGKTSPLSLFWVFLRLGLTSFGGPVAHLGYFREAFVVRRKWFSEESYADLVALCQFLPGPASSQVGLAVGLTRGGYLGALAAWTGFTMPSALALVLFALGVAGGLGDAAPGVLHGLKTVAVAVVAQAVWGMGRSLTPDVPRLTLMAGATCLVVLMPTAVAQLLVIGLSGLVGVFFFRGLTTEANGPRAVQSVASRWLGAIWILAFFGLLIGLPFFAEQLPSQWLALVNSFYRSGALVFGGGHVVLPLLQAEVVPTGWVSEDAFLAGYGAAQAVPGPLFTFAAFLGAVMTESPTGWLGGLICLGAVFLPSFFLVAGVLPFWDDLRSVRILRAALVGVNAGVVGLLLAALYDPVWTATIKSPSDFALALVALIALMAWKLPSWLVVIGAGCAGWAMSQFGIHLAL